MCGCCLGELERVAGNAVESKGRGGVSVASAGGTPAFDRLNPDPNHIPDLDFRAGHLVFGPALDVAQSYLGHFGVGVGEVRRHLRGSVLPSVDLVQDVGQHEVPHRQPAPAATRRNMASLMVMARSAK